jgi:insulysin
MVIYLISIVWPLLQSNVSALIDMKLEKYKNIREESAFFWGEISEGTLKFDRKEVEVCIP